MSDAGSAAARGTRVHRASTAARLEAWTRSRPQVADTALALVLAAVLLPSGIGVLTSSMYSTAAQVALIATLVVLHSTVAVRRVSPRTAFVVAALCMLVLVVVPDAHSTAADPPGGSAVVPLVVPSSLVFCVLLYTVARESNDLAAGRALAVGAVGALGVIARMWNFGEIADCIGSGLVADRHGSGDRRRGRCPVGTGPHAEARRPAGGGRGTR